MLFKLINKSWLDVRRDRIESRRFYRSSSTIIRATWVATIAQCYSTTLQTFGRATTPKNLGFVSSNREWCMYIKILVDNGCFVCANIWSMNGVIRNIMFFFFLILHRLFFLFSLRKLVGVSCLNKQSKHWEVQHFNERRNYRNTINYLIGLLKVSTKRIKFENTYVYRALFICHSYAY